MASYTVTVKRKYQNGGINPPITIVTQGGEYTIETGKEISFSMPAGKNKIIFTCTTNIGNLNTTRTKDVEFFLYQDSVIEISCYTGVISIDKLPPEYVEPQTKEVTYNNSTSNQVKQHINNIDNKNTSENIIAKLWNNACALYITSAILFAVSLIVTAIINIGFILVELIGAVAVIIMAIYFNSWEFFSIEGFSKVLFVAVAIGLILMIFALIIEGPNVNIGWQEEWHKCYKCNGSGKVKNDFGWNVTCPSCDGVGGFYY